MKRTERIEMVLLHTSNELKKKYKLLRKLRLCLNILIKNEEKKIHHLDVSKIPAI